MGGKGEARVIARVGHEWGMCRGEIEVPMGERASYMFSTKKMVKSESRGKVPPVPPI